MRRWRPVEVVGNSPAHLTEVPRPTRRLPGIPPGDPEPREEGEKRGERWGPSCPVN